MKKLLTTLFTLFTFPAYAVFYDLHVEGDWNPLTNTPKLVAGQGQEGLAYRVSADSTSCFDSICMWNEGDLVYFDHRGHWNRLTGPNGTVTYGVIAGAQPSTASSSGVPSYTGGIPLLEQYTSGLTARGLLISNGQSASSTVPEVNIITNMISQHGYANKLTAYKAGFQTNVYAKGSSANVWGGVINMNHDSSAASDLSVIGLEIDYNNAKRNCSTVNANYCVGQLITAPDYGFYSASALAIEAGNKNWNYGVTFNGAGAIRQASIYDASDAAQSYKMEGNHSVGIDAENATISGLFLRGPGSKFTVDPNGNISALDGALTITQSPSSVPTGNAQFIFAPTISDTNRNAYFAYLNSFGSMPNETAFYAAYNLKIGEDQTNTPIPATQKGTFAGFECNIYTAQTPTVTPGVEGNHCFGGTMRGTGGMEMRGSAITLETGVSATTDIFGHVTSIQNNAGGGNQNAYYANCTGTQNCNGAAFKVEPVVTGGGVFTYALHAGNRGITALSDIAFSSNGYISGAVGDALRLTGDGSAGGFIFAGTTGSTPGHARFRNTAGGADLATINLTTGDIVSSGGLQSTPVAVASLGTCNSGAKGMIKSVSDGAAALAWGATISGGGSAYYTVNCNGANWTVMGK